MTLSAEQLQTGSRIEAKVQKLIREGYDDAGIFLEMADDMPALKPLLDCGHGTVDELCRRFLGFYRYAKILERVASGIASGEIQVPK